MAFLKLIRYKNLLMVLLTMILTKYALIESFLEETYLSNFDFYILILSVLLITAGGYIINDIYDIEADKINKPNKVFIDKTISKKTAWISYLLLNITGLVLGIYLSNKILNIGFSFLFIFSSILLLVYSYYLKNVIFIGNFFISILISLSIFIVLIFNIPFGAEMYNLKNFSLSNVLNFFIFFSFITTLIREIIKDIEDIDGDLKLKAKTLPIVIGRKRASKVAFLFSCILLLILFIVLQFIKDEFIFLVYGIVFILLPLLYFLYKLWFAETKKDFSKLSSLMKIIMLFGILSMLLFKF